MNARLFIFLFSLWPFLVYSCHSPSSMSPFEAASGKPVQVVTPTASPVAGFYATSQTVTLTTTTADASIRYTLDGSSPSSGTVYTAPVLIGSNSTLRIQAFKSGFPDSSEYQGYYQVGAATPTFQITTTNANGTSQTLSPGNSYTASNDISSIQILYSPLSGNASDGQIIYYTTDGSTPSTSSSVYTAGTNLGPLTNGNTLNLKAFAAVSGWNSSLVASTSLAVVYTSTHVAVGQTPATLTISGASSCSLAAGATYVLTAVDYAGNAVTPSSMQWYLNSLAIVGGASASITIDSSTLVNINVSLVAGQYTLSCVAVCNGVSYSQSKTIIITN